MALVSFESHYKRLAESPEQLSQDAAKLAQMRTMVESLKTEAARTGRLDDPMPSGGAHWVPDASNTVIPVVDEASRAIAILEANNISCQGDGNRFSVVVHYQKQGRDWTMDGEIAAIERRDGRWELMVITAPYFWGDDWREKPLFLTADTLPEIARFLVNTLTPRMHGRTLSVPG